jgi:hypothetical protein
LLTIAPSANSNTAYFTMDDALSIATHTKEYSEFPELSYWYDARMLYEQLKFNEDFRKSHSILQEFYNDGMNQYLEQLNTTDELLSTFIKSIGNKDSNLEMQHLQNLENSNDNIPNSEIQNANEKLINAIYLKLERYGIDYLSIVDKNFIHDLANQCPYIAGSAVYKARTLIAIYNPMIMFYDIEICNNVGLYKTNNSSNVEDGLFKKENVYLKNFKKTPTEIRKTPDFVVYPNPNSGIINLIYELLPNKNGHLIIYDVLGNKLIEVPLAISSTKTMINIKNLSSGVYIYRFFIGDVTIYFGKFIKE